MYGGILVRAVSFANSIRIKPRMFDPRKVDVMKACQLIYNANQITVFYITAILLLNVLMILQKANIFNTPRLSTILNIK